MPARILKLVIKMSGKKENLTLDELVEINQYCYSCTGQELKYLTLIGTKFFETNGK